MRLSSVSGTNDSRDFWRAVKLPLAPRAAASAEIVKPVAGEGLPEHLLST